MDWLQDNDILDVDTSGHVFGYQEGPTTLVRLSPLNAAPLVWHMHDKSDWDDWFKTEYPKLNGSSDPGLVLVLAKRVGEISFPKVKRVSSSVWLEQLDQAPRSPTEKNLAEMVGRRTMQILPFSKQLFGKIAHKFYIHSSMARTVSRADVSSFSAADLFIKDQDGTASPAFVYTCRTSHAWGRDLALSATYFPRCGLTFAIMFGCTVSVEQQVIKRLERATLESCHPLLMPGILVELERLRHIAIVDKSIDELETRILELSSFSEQVESLSAQEQLARNEAKRSAWLDTTYLRNHLITWAAQLEKLSRHVDKLSESGFQCKTAEQINMGEDVVPDIVSPGLGDPPSWRLALSEKALPPSERTLPDIPSETGGEETELQTHCSTDRSSDRSSYGTQDTLLGTESEGTDLQEHYSPDMTSDVSQDMPLEYKLLNTDPATDLAQEQMRRIGKKIKARVLDVIEEYNEKIRDCTMRVDGMAMSTQWAQGETSVEIATATGRDSRHMRSIALVTMIFLPGTFFASVFSMSFFDWSGSGDGSNVVSGYLWIYIVIVFVFTVTTLGCWWYFGVHRHLRRRKTEIVELS